MASFNDIYKQTITLFNRVKIPDSDDSVWLPTVIDGVHLVTTSSSAWNTRGERETDDVRLHVRYAQTGNDVLISCRGQGGEVIRKKWYEPKAWRKLEEKDGSLTFAFGDTEAFDFFMEGVYEDGEGEIYDSSYPRKGFYNYMNTNYDNVFAITSVAKYNLIPHFEIMAR